VEEDFPRKPFYTIGEVSRLTGVKPHVLRYWEGIGKLLKPSRRRSRHRLYRAADIQLIFEIKRLRDEEKLTLAAMRRQLNPQTPRLPAPAPFLPRSPEGSLAALLRDLKEELQALKALLD
jgi:DNA-binding transcriptional MerR regulator